MIQDRSEEIRPESPEERIYPLDFVCRYIIRRREELVEFESHDFHALQKIQQKTGELLRLLQGEGDRSSLVSEAKSLQLMVQQLQVDMTKKGFVFENMNHMLQQSNFLIEDLIFKDNLVRAYNRYFYITHTAALFAEAREKHGMSMAFLDIDNFKHFNTVYGHDFGDAALQKLGDVVQEIILDHRSIHFIRMGGDEFVLLEDGEMLYEDFLGLLVTLQDRLHHTLIRYNGQESGISISIGAANTKSDDISSAEELYRKSDTRLYQAKDKGKDCLVHA